MSEQGKTYYELTPEQVAQGMQDIVDTMKMSQESILRHMSKMEKRDISAQDLVKMCVEATDEFENNPGSQLNEQEFKDLVIKGFLKVFYSYR